MCTCTLQPARRAVRVGPCLLGLRCTWDRGWIADAASPHPHTQHTERERDWPVGRLFGCIHDQEEEASCFRVRVPRPRAHAHTTWRYGPPHQSTRTTCVPSSPRRHPSSQRAEAEAPFHASSTCRSTPIHGACRFPAAAAAAAANSAFPVSAARARGVVENVCGAAGPKKLAAPESESNEEPAGTVRRGSRGEDGETAPNKPHGNKPTQERMGTLRFLLVLYSHRSRPN